MNDSNRALERIITEIEARYVTGYAIPRSWEAGGSVIDTGSQDITMSWDLVSLTICEIAKHQLSGFFESKGHYFLWIEILIFNEQPTQDTILSIEPSDNDVFYKAPYHMRDERSAVELFLCDDAELIIQSCDLEFMKRVADLTGEFGLLMDETVFCERSQ